MEQFNRNQGVGVSNRYKVFNTSELVQQFTSRGYSINQIQEQYYRDKALKGSGKHLIRLRHPDFKVNIDGLIPEIILRNSYNGTSCFEISLGIFRLVCSNGLMAGTKFSSFKVKHVGKDAIYKVFDSINQVQESSQLLEQAVKRFQGVQLTPNQISFFAHQAVELLVPKDATNIEYLDILKVRRIEDRPNDLWTVFNKIQENALKGGLKYQIIDTDIVNGQIKHIAKNNSTRAIKSLDRLVKVNRELWNIAERLAV